MGWAHRIWAGRQRQRPGGDREVAARCSGVVGVVEWRRMDTHVMPVQSGVKSYIFKAAIVEEDDGRWSAWIDALPGCSTWGHTPAEAMTALREAAQAYIEVLIEKGRGIPSRGVETVDAPVVTVTV